MTFRDACFCSDNGDGKMEYPIESGDLFSRGLQRKYKRKKKKLDRRLKSLYKKV